MGVETLKWWWAGDKGRASGRREVVWFFETDPARLEVMTPPPGPEWWDYGCAPLCLTCPIAF